MKYLFQGLATLGLLSLAVGCGGGLGGGGGGGGGGGIPIDTSAGPVAPALYTYVLNQVNAMRAAENPAAAPLVRDAGLDVYAQAGSDDLMATGIPHRHFALVSIFPSCPAALAPTAGTDAPGDPLASCPEASARENQGYHSAGATHAAVDGILGLFLAEKPLALCSHGRGHYEAIIDPEMNHVGIGLSLGTSGGLYLTLDFSD